MKKYGDLLSGIIGMLVAAVVFALSVQIGLKEGDAIGADFLPKIVAVITFVFSLVLTYRGYVSARSYVAEPSAFPPNTTGVLIAIVACFVYAQLLKPVGFVITSMVFLFLMLFLMAKKEEFHVVKSLVITVVSVMAIYLIFTEIFGIRLPYGIL